jgi:hypothetical protein
MPRINRRQTSSSPGRVVWTSNDAVALRCPAGRRIIVSTVTCQAGDIVLVKRGKLPHIVMEIHEGGFKLLSPRGIGTVTAESVLKVIGHTEFFTSKPFADMDMQVVLMRVKSGEIDVWRIIQQAMLKRNTQELGNNDLGTPCSIHARDK